MEKVSKMSIRNILKQTDIFIYEKQLIYVLKDPSSLFKLNSSRTKPMDEYETFSFLVENDDNIDKEKLVFMIAKNSKEFMDQMSNRNLNNNEKSQYEQAKKRYEKCLKLLKNKEVEIPVVDIENGRMFIKDFLTNDDILDNNGKKCSKRDEKRREENLQLLNKIEEEIGLESILLVGTMEDFEEFVCYYKENGPVFQNIVINNATDRFRKFINKEMKKDEDFEKNSEIASKKQRILLLQEANQVILDYPEKFDIEKLLLISAYRAKDLLESYQYDQFAPIEIECFTQIMRIAQKVIKNPKLKISGRIETIHDGKRKEMTYSAEMLEEDVQKIINGKYYSKAEILEEKRKILEGEIDLGGVNSSEYLDILNFSLKEKKELIAKNPKNLEYLSIFRQLEDEQIQESLKEIEGFKFNFMFVDSLYTHGIIDKSDIVDLYMKNNMDLTNALNMNEEHDLEPEITVEELMKYYEEMKEDEEKTKDFDRYSLLFRELRIKGKSEEVREEIAEQMAMKVCESDTEYEDFKTLYEANLLPIKTLIEWNDEDIIYDLIKNRALKPKDARNLLMTGSLNLSKVHQTLQESDLSNEEKLNFIYSSFNGVGKNPEEVEAQNEARMYLIQGLNISNEMVKIEKPEQITTRKIRNRNTEKIERNRYVSDPIYRWQLFAELDEDCDIKLYKDGTAKVTLPNLNQVIIEKLFKHTKGSIKNNYGSATYLMSQEEFDSNKARIIEDEKINRKALVEMQEVGTANKLVHSLKWGKALKENLDISLENGYSKEKIEKIDNLVERIEKARELVD